MLFYFLFAELFLSFDRAELFLTTVPSKQFVIAVVYVSNHAFFTSTDARFHTRFVQTFSR